MGGSGSEAAHNISNTADGGYILGGRATSTDGDLCMNAGLADFWIVKLNSLGLVEWKKTFGGNANDICNSVSVSPDGGFLMAGGTLSTNGDVSGKKGAQDLWAVKLLLEPSVQPTVLINSSQTRICKGQDIQFVATAQHGGTSPLYSWQVNGSPVGSGNDTIILDNLNNGDLFNCVLTSSDRCLMINSDTSNLISITIDESLNPKNFLPADIIKCEHETATLSGGVNYTSYLWSNNSTIAHINVTTPGIYWLEVVDQNGCKGRDSILVARKNDCIKGVYVPSGFTPNHDGRNDSFGPVVNAVLSKYEFSIFNVWGQRVFHTTDHLKKWNGTISSREQNSAVFTWMLFYQIEGEEPVRKKGTVMLIR